MRELEILVNLCSGSGMDQSAYTNNRFMNKATFILSAVALMTLPLIAGEPLRIGLIGDSTVAEQSGWGPAFARQVNDRAEVINSAKNGATLVSLSKELDRLLLRKPDFVLIQFGHNDQKHYDPTVYAKHLKSYADRIRKAGARPVILSSVVRRTFDKHGMIVSDVVETEKFAFKAGLGDYAKAAGTLAKELGAPFIDLYSLSEAHHNDLGQEASMSYNFAEGDRTHFNPKGARAIAGLIIPELTRQIPELADCFAAATPPADEVFSREAQGR